jgi:hypothetical protein
MLACGGARHVLTRARVRTLLHGTGLLLLALLMAFSGRRGGPTYLRIVDA